jgi:hypothetical protein
MYLWIKAKMSTSYKSQDQEFDFMYDEKLDEFEQFKLFKRKMMGSNTLIDHSDNFEKDNSVVNRQPKTPMNLG